jgi:hypothetical protein
LGGVLSGIHSIARTADGDRNNSEQLEESVMWSDWIGRFTNVSSRIERGGTTLQYFAELID